jgi:hypothetical protein
VKKFVCIILLATAGTPLFAQDGGSAYTAFGIGDIRYAPSVRSMGMGYTGIGLPSASYINAMMPAAWSRIAFVRVEANGMYEGINTAEANRSLFQARGLFNGALLALPISTAKGIVFVGGFTPYSYVRYHTFFENAQNGVVYTINQIGSGGLSKAQIGFSYAPTEDLAFGASLNYLFGTILQDRVLFDTTNKVRSTLSIEQANRGLNLTLSGLFNGFGRMSESLRPLSLGVMVTTEARMKFDLSSRVSVNEGTTALDTIQKRMSFPISFGVGAAYQIADRWLIAADYFTQAWSSARIDGQPFTFIRNSSRFGIGAEKLPLKDATKLLDKFAYRLGFSYNQTYYKVFGEPINEIAFTTGVTMPITGETRLNVGIEYATRGVKERNLVKDNIIRVAFSLSIVEPWFVRYEEE